MKKEVQKLFRHLDNNQINCIFVETAEKNWLFKEYSTIEQTKEEKFNHIFWDGINGSSDSYHMISKDKKSIINTVDKFIDIVAGNDKVTDIIHWILDVNMLSDLKDNYGKILTLLKSTNIQDTKTKIIFVDPDFSKIPEDLKQFTTLVKIPLPNKEEISEIITTRITGLNPDYIVTDDNLKLLVDSAIGLSRKTIRESLTDSWNIHKDFLPTTFQTIRYDFINRNPCLNSIKWENDTTELIGLQKLKDFVVNMIKSGKGRGVLLVGVAGSGKSQFAKYIGKQTNQLVVNLDLAKMKGKYVGDTERMTRDSIETIDTIGNCVVLVDEIEKGLSGVNSSGDSGSSANQGATFLKWLSDKPEGGSYIIATANNIDQLPSEYKRAERWDGIFFLDLPSEEIRKGIIDFYINHYKIDKKKNKTSELLSVTDNWTGAEIKTMCRLSSALKKDCVEIADDYVTTIYSVDKEKIDTLRKWSVGRTISCEYKPKISETKPLKTVKLNNRKDLSNDRI